MSSNHCALCSNQDMHVVAAVDCDVLSTTPITTTISIVFTNSCRHLWLLCCCVLGLGGLLSRGPYLLSYQRMYLPLIYTAEGP